MTKKAGSVFGGALLITGSCIGVGMLGLPIPTGMAGFFPSSALLFIAWLFMLTTALLLVEIMGWFPKPVNLISMVEQTLGPIGKILCWLLYVFLLYALLVAYISASGNHFNLLSTTLFSFPLPDWGGSLFFVLLFGWIICLGMRPVDFVNRYLMYGKILSFALLIFLGARHMTPHLLLHWEPQYALFTFPILIISFGFHNMVPVLMKYMKGDRKRVRRAIYAGSFLTIFIYLLWEVVALGVLPIGTIVHSYKVDIDAAQALRGYLGSSVVGYAAQGLAFFAILTSFLAQSLSLTNFLSDGFKIKQREGESIGMSLLTLAPPLIFALFFPHIFFQALNFAGGICAVILFGLFPALMTWIGRYRQGHLLPDRLPGGRPLLFVVFLISCSIFFDQFMAMLSVDLLPRP